jgi:putative transposase
LANLRFSDVRSSCSAAPCEVRGISNLLPRRNAGICPSWTARYAVARPTPRICPTSSTLKVGLSGRSRAIKATSGAGPVASPVTGLSARVSDCSATRNISSISSWSACDWSTERLAEAGIETSVGSRGDSYDNALAESMIGLYKAEVIRHEGPWKGLDEVEYATLGWVDWFNRTRLIELIGYVPPAEFEEPYYAQAASARDDALKQVSLH